MSYYFIPPFYWIDGIENICYNRASNTLSEVPNFNSETLLELSDRNVSILKNKVLKAKLEGYG
jgi:hypothetical protein